MAFIESVGSIRPRSAFITVVTFLSLHPILLVLSLTQVHFSFYLSLFLNTNTLILHAWMLWSERVLKALMPCSLLTNKTSSQSLFVLLLSHLFWCFHLFQLSFYFGDEQKLLVIWFCLELSNSLRNQLYSLPSDLFFFNFNQICRL